MATVNKAVLIGNLTSDVELKQLPSGSAVANFNLEMTEVYVDKAGDRQETTTRVDVEVFGRQAETCAQYLSKGRQVLVEGRLKMDQWQDKEGGKRSRLLVRALNVRFLDPAPPPKPEPPPAKPVQPPAEPPINKSTEPDYPPEWDDVEVPPFG